MIVDQQLTSRTPTKIQHQPTNQPTNQPASHSDLTGTSPVNLPSKEPPAHLYRLTATSMCSSSCCASCSRSSKHHTPTVNLRLLILDAVFPIITPDHQKQDHDNRTRQEEEQELAILVFRKTATAGRATAHASGRAPGRRRMRYRSCWYLVVDVWAEGVRGRRAGEWHAVV